MQYERPQTPPLAKVPVRIAAGARTAGSEGPIGWFHLYIIAIYHISYHGLVGVSYMAIIGIAGRPMEI